MHFRLWPMNDYVLTVACLALTPIRAAPTNTANNKDHIDIAEVIVVYGIVCKGFNGVQTLVSGSNIALEKP